MKIFNTDTQQIIDLRHPYYDTDVMADLTADDGTITFDSDREMRVADSESIEWWETWSSNDAEALEMADEVKDRNYDAYQKLQADIIDACSCDLEDQPAASKQVLENWASENSLEFWKDSHGNIGLRDKV